MNTVKDKKVTGMDYMWLCLMAVLGIGIEVIIAFLLEPMIWKAPMQQWSTGACILHWIITCAIWCLLGICIIRRSKMKCGFDPFMPTEKPAAWQWIATAVCAAVCLIVTWIDWKGCKVLIEFKANGWLKFIFQYIYYLFEVMLFLLIIVYAQKAFETWFKKPNIPYGAIIAALTWGLAHWGTKGSVYAGLLSAAGGFCFGVVYLLLNRDIKLTYIMLCIMFIL